jgi:hypothetical protein
MHQGTTEVWAIRLCVRELKGCSCRAVTGGPVSRLHLLVVLRLYTLCQWPRLSGAVSQCQGTTLHTLCLLTDLEESSALQWWAVKVCDTRDLLHQVDLVI